MSTDQYEKITAAGQEFWVPVARKKGEKVPKEITDPARARKRRTDKVQEQLNQLQVLILTEPVSLEGLGILLGLTDSAIRAIALDKKLRHTEDIVVDATKTIEILEGQIQEDEERSA